MTHRLGNPQQGIRRCAAACESRLLRHDVRVVFRGFAFRTFVITRIFFMVNDRAFERVVAVALKLRPNTPNRQGPRDVGAWTVVEWTDYHALPHDDRPFFA